MTKPENKSLCLAVITGTWIALTIGVFFLSSSHKLSNQPLLSSAPHGLMDQQEPPPTRPMWDRISTTARKLIGVDPRHPVRGAIRKSLERLGVHTWHRNEVHGQGIKIAILDSGFKNYREAIGKLLPPNVKVKSFRKDGLLDARDSQHGLLCAEVIHHIAPSAEIMFANWEPETPSSFLEAVKWARKEGAHIISCSIIMPTWSDGEGGGAIHQTLHTELGEGKKPTDGLLVASAGNTALRHWGGRLSPDQMGLHQWAKGKTENQIRPLSHDRVSVELTSPDTTPLELIVRDQSTGKEVGRTRSIRNGTYSIAVVRFDPSSYHRYNVQLRQVNFDPTRRVPSPQFHLTVLGGKLTYTTKQGSIPFPGDGSEVIAVGAVDEAGRRFGYSSCGPNGVRPKPDLTARVPFPCLWRPDQPFSGTSAAAPQVAAQAALIWSKHPDWPAIQVRKALERSARSIGKTHSHEFGHGLAQMPVFPQ